LKRYEIASPMKYQLVPENIDTVVKQRLLDKTSLASDKIRKLFDDYSGVLSMAATIKHPNAIGGFADSRRTRRLQEIISVVTVSRQVDSANPRTNTIARLAFLVR